MATTPPFMPSSTTSDPATQTPSASPVAALLARIFGTQANPGVSAGAPPAGGSTSTAAVTPLAQLAGIGAPPAASTMPAGVPGVPANNLLNAPPQVQSRPLPSPNAMLGSSFSFPNKAAKNGAVMSTGIENVSEAIHNFKVQKDNSEYQKAKSTWDLYQKAAALDPQTGQPVDPHTMAILSQDPKIVKSWEKMLKMEFPHQPGPPDSKTGKPTQGAPIIPQPTTDPAAMTKQLLEQRQLQQVRNAPGETGGLTPKEEHQAALIAAGIQPKAVDQRTLDKIDAEIDNLRSEKAEHEAQAAKLAEDMKRIPAQNALDLERARTEIQRQKTLAAEAEKDLKEAVKSKSLQEFTIGRSSIKDVLTSQAKTLTKMQQKAMNERSRLGKAFGSAADVSPEQDAQQNRVTALNDAYTAYVGMQDDVEAGRLTATDAMTKARRSAGLDSDFDMWSGVPSDAPQTPPKELPEGYAMKNADGVDIAVKQGNKWVAP